MFDSKCEADAATIVAGIGERLNDYAWVGYERYSMVTGHWWWFNLLGFRAEDETTGLKIALRRRVGVWYTHRRAEGKLVRDERDAVGYEIEITDPKRLFDGPFTILKEEFVFFADEGEPANIATAIRDMFSKFVGSAQVDEGVTLQESLEALFTHLHGIADFDYKRRGGEKPPFEAIMAAL